MVISVLRMNFGKRLAIWYCTDWYEDALPAVDHVGRLGGQHLVHPDGERVDVGQRADVGRRALQHCHVSRARIRTGPE